MNEPSIMRHWVCLPLLAGVALCAGCGTSNSASGTTELKSSLARITPDPSVATSASTDEQAFAWNFFQKLDATTNQVFSPYSISLASAMLSEAAAGDTLTQMQQALHFSASSTPFDASQDALELALEAQNHDADKVQGTPALTLRVSDDLWIRDGFAPTQTYLDTLASYYGTGMHQFADPGAATTAINAKVSADTNALIPQLLTSPLDQETQFVLSNVLYFKGNWPNPLTDAPGVPFHRLDGSTSSPTMLTNVQSESSFFGYAQADGYQALSLPYAASSLELLVILPDEAGFDTLRAKLDATFVSGIVAQEQTKSVVFELPKFDVDQDMGGAFEDTLKALGMTALFTLNPELPAFGGKIDHIQAVHHTHVIVDENGTAAAAATAFGGSTAAVELTPMLFTVDRPFFFAIRDSKTNAVLFIGQIVDPS
jgi:serpin B